MIYELTPKDFKTLNKLDNKFINKIVIVKFYLPYCGPCKETIYEYERLANALDRDNKYIVAQIDCDKYNKITMNNLEYGVKLIEGFPTIILYKKNTFIHSIYEGSRDADSWFNAMSQVD